MHIVDSRLREAGWQRVAVELRVRARSRKGAHVGPPLDPVAGEQRQEIGHRPKSEERRVGKECVRSVDLGGRCVITTNTRHRTIPNNVQIRITTYNNKPTEKTN